MQFIALAGGIGALLWGIAADYFPARRLLIAMAVLSLLAGLSLWLPGGDGTDLLILSVARGGLVSIPWVLMADYLPMRHFAKLALAITWVGSMGTSLVLLVESLGFFLLGLDPRRLGRGLVHMGCTGRGGGGAGWGGNLPAQGP